VARHPELAGHVAWLISAVQAPDSVHRGRFPGQEWLYLAEAGPSRWLKVIVDYDGDRGLIITAFPRRAKP
jgi:hypothetical protein